MSSTNPIFMIGLQFLNFWLLKVMLRCINDDVTIIKHGHQATGNARVILLDESSFTLFPTSIRKSLRLENTQGSQQSGKPGSISDTRGRLCDGLGSNIVVQYSVVPIITLDPISVREYVDSLGSQLHSTIQMLFPNNDVLFQVVVWRAWRWTSTSSLASTVTRSEHHWITVVSFED
jgi:hypothetical protein